MGLALMALRCTVAFGVAVLLLDDEADNDETVKLSLRQRFVPAKQVVGD